MESTYENLKKLGDTALEQKYYVLALEYYEKALDKAPEKPEPYKDIGNVYLNRQDLDIAEQYYRQALDKDPNYWNAHHNLGRIYTKKKSTRQQSPTTIRQ